MKVYQARLMLVSIQGGRLPVALGTFETPEQAQELAGMTGKILQEVKLVTPDGQQQPIGELFKVMGIHEVGLNIISYNVASPIVAAAPAIILPGNATKQ